MPRPRRPSSESATSSSRASARRQKSLSLEVARQRKREAERQAAQLYSLLPQLDLLLALLQRLADQMHVGVLVGSSELVDRVLRSGRLLATDFSDLSASAHTLESPPTISDKPRLEG